MRRRPASSGDTSRSAPKGSALAHRLPDGLRPGLEIIRRLRAAGWESYLVGGVVRDLMLERPPTDLDIVTAAPPEAIMSLFDRTVPIGAEFGVIAVVLGDRSYQVATFRREGPYLDGRRPSYVELADARADVQRRDFTVNALLYDPLDDRLLDLVGALADLDRRVIRTVGDPDARFAEDRLRMLRAVRLAAELGFSVEAGTVAAIERHAAAVATVSAERIREEVLRLLVAPGRARGVRLAARTGLLAAVLPEVAQLGAEPDPAAIPPRTRLDVALAGLQALNRPPARLALATLLRDLDPATVDAICRRLKCANPETRAVAALVEHLPLMRELASAPPARCRVACERAGAAELLELFRVDLVARTGGTPAYARAAEVIAALAGGSPRAPLLSGADLIALGYAPGPRFAEMLVAVDAARARGEIATADEARAWVLRQFPAGPDSRTVERSGDGDTAGEGGDQHV